MLPFTYERVNNAKAAAAAVSRARSSEPQGAAQFLAGGTTLIDLMRLNVMRPDHLVDINALAETKLGRIEGGSGGMRLGALTRMSEAAEHPEILRRYPVIAQSLKFAASQQIRNMATLGGNVM